MGGLGTNLVFCSAVGGNAVVSSGPELRYACDLGRLPTGLADRFVALDSDPTTRAFVREAPHRRHGWLLTQAQVLLSSLLGDFEANGLLGTYPMHLLSTGQWRELLGGRPGGRLLDIGAGSGDVTTELVPLFDEVETTESSWAMARRLRRRGLRCTRTDLLDDAVPDPPYGTIACLNVLDRCDRPLRLLTTLVGGVEPGGRLLLSLPLIAPALLPVRVRRFQRAQPERPAAAGGRFELGAEPGVARARRAHPSRTLGRRVVPSPLPLGRRLGARAVRSRRGRSGDSRAYLTQRPSSALHSRISLS